MTRELRPHTRAACRSASMGARRGARRPVAMGAAALAAVLCAPARARAQSAGDAGATVDAAPAGAAGDAGVATAPGAGPVAPAAGAGPAAGNAVPRADAPPNGAAPPRAPAPASASGARATASSGEGQARASGRATLVLGGYVETFYAVNFNFPSNGLTNFRGFDNRHNAFTISNAVVDFAFRYESVSGRVAAQVGHTPESYYAAEPGMSGAAGAGASNANIWKFLQQANVGWRAPLGRGLLIEAGLFLSPIGIESMLVRENWNWSRSDLFFGLPFYHTGLRLAYPATDRITLSLAGFNGWNSVVDNNPEKSVSAQFQYTIPNVLAFSALYFGGIERNERVAEGRPWRHMLDTHITLHPLRRLSLAAHFNTGFETGNAFGLAAWVAGAVYARVRIVDQLFLALRGDAFYEAVPGAPAGMPAASPIFWANSPWVASGTATLDVRPIDHVLMRLEYRHDHAGAPLYFRDTVGQDASGAWVPNAAWQDTLTIGMTAWF